MHLARKQIGAAGADQPRYPVAVRGVFHGAIAVYLASYLNVPPAPLPGPASGRLDALPSGSEDLRAALLDAFDRQRQVDDAARVIAR